MYSTLHLKNRVLCRSLSLTLVIGLLLQCFTPLLPEREVWDEKLCPGVRRGRYVYRRRYRFGVVRVLTLRSGVLFCRLALVAALLVWSGWTADHHEVWALLSLPMVDFLLASLPLL